MAAADGWVGEIHESTTGSMVSKNQLMGKIRIYDYDFFTWQQRYVIELSNAALVRRPPLAPMYEGRADQLKKIISAQQQSGALHPDIGPATPPPVAAQGNTEAGPAPEMEQVTSEQSAASPASTPSMQNMAKHKGQGRLYTGEQDKLYPSQVRQELMDLGVGENQLEQLAKSGVYITDIELRSPADGLVLSRNIFPHERITRGTECFRVADLSRVWVEADIYDLEAQIVQPGMQALVSMPRMDKHYPATVSEVLPRFEAAGRTLKVRLEMDNPEILFRPDMFVDVEFLVNLPPAIAVPSSAIINSGKRQTVYVAAEEGVFEPREVLTGRHYNDRVEIIKGLQLGEKIVVSGNFLIDSESRMKLAAVRLMDKVEYPPEIRQDEQDELTNPVQMTMPHDSKKTMPKGMVRDPICGMNIDPVKAEEAGLTIEADGKTYYFCSEECAEEFHRHGPQLDASPEHMEHNQ